MRFEPRIIKEDEPLMDESNELDLPDDLMMLAEQLCDDANYLSTRYPAEMVDEEPVVLASANRNVLAREEVAEKKTWQKASSRMALFASLTSLVVLVAVLGINQFRDQDTSIASINTSQNQNDTAVVVGENAKLASQNSVNLTAASVIDDEGSTDFEGLTGAQKVGMLDLLEQDPPAKTLLSI